MMRILSCLALAVFMVFAATAEKRAFVVGVGEYQNLSDLRKTTGDAQGYSDLFGGELDFEVTKLIDPTQLEFVEAFGTFLETVSEGDEVVFVFSGHGWTDNAENYLVMSDAPLEASQFALKSQTVPLSTVVLSELKRKNPQLVLAIIDACRENPFDGMTRSLVPVGLVPVQAPEGMLLMFAAGDRQLALDRLNARDESPYSVFTRMLLPLLQDTDRPLQEIARDVKDDVRDLAMTIQHDQRPAYYDELLGDYCLSGKCRESKSSDDPSTRAWTNANSARLEERCEALSSYINAFPEGDYVSDANTALQALLCEGGRSPVVEHQNSMMMMRHDMDVHLHRARRFEHDQEILSALQEYATVVMKSDGNALLFGYIGTVEAYAKWMFLYRTRIIDAGHDSLAEEYFDTQERLDIITSRHMGTIRQARGVDKSDPTLLEDVPYLSMSIAEAIRAAVRLNKIPDFCGSDFSEVDDELEFIHLALRLQPEEEQESLRKLLFRDCPERFP